jgi:hypothetical protein
MMRVRAAGARAVWGCGATTVPAVAVWANAPAAHRNGTKAAAAARLMLASKEVGRMGMRRSGLNEYGIRG